MEPKELKVIGLTGRSGAGKTLIARSLQQHLWLQVGYLAKVLPMAQPLKDFLKELGVLRDHPHFRDAAQYLGGLRKVINRDVYCTAFESQLERMLPAFKWIIVDDLRFPHEAQWLCSKHQAFLVRLMRLERPNETRLTTTQARHESELCWDRISVDLEVANESTPEWAAEHIWEHAREVLDEPK